MSTRAFLKRISSTSANSAQYVLSPTQTIVIGRELTCQIVLDSVNYQGVSRRHLEVRPVSSGTWEISDLGSANGTYINGQKLQGNRILQHGDRIHLGRNSTYFQFECQQVNPTPNIRPIPIQPDDSLHLSQMLPIVSNQKALFQKAFLIPGILTVLLVVGLFASLGNPFLFNALLAISLAIGAYYFIYQLSGKPKPWWLLVGSAIMTIFVLISPLFIVFLFIFRQILPGSILESPDAGFITIFIHMFFGAGLMEELIKALPIFAALWFGRMLRSPWKERLGVWEPLDGILIGAASAMGFTLLETMFQYVPGIVQQVSEQSGAGAGELIGIQLLIPRILGSIAGHMAYSGYFGYFIGLSTLKPSKRWSILGIGYLTSSLLHALWNSSESLSIFVTAIVGILSYAFLMAAILKARQLSPTRSQNFRTRLNP